nr:hypothetical protein [Bacteroidota bacterium]
MDTVRIVNVTPENVLEQSLICIKDLKNPGFPNKQKWFNQRFEEGMRLNILRDQSERPIAFIEYIPTEFAWRPVDANNYMFIHCMYVYANKDKHTGYGSMLVDNCEEDATSRGMDGVCVMTSKGSWIASKLLFEKNGFSEIDKRGRFELMTKKFNESAPDPKLIVWTAKQKNYQGWHLLYADQCPWHEKSVLAIKEVANEAGINLQIKKISSAHEAKNGPSGFGVFALLHDGKLLEDHYLSQTRFINILKKETGA